MNESARINLWPGLEALLAEESQFFSGGELGLSAETRELMGALVGQLKHCRSGEDLYRRALKDRGWSDERITHILQDIDAHHLNPKERALMRFSCKLTLHPQGMSLDDTEELRQAGLEDRTILEAAAITAYLNGRMLLANALDAMPAA